MIIYFFYLSGAFHIRSYLTEECWSVMVSEANRMELCGFNTVARFQIHQWWLFWEVPNIWFDHHYQTPPLLLLLGILLSRLQKCLDGYARACKKVAMARKAQIFPTVGAWYIRCCVTRCEWTRNFWSWSNRGQFTFSVVYQHVSRRSRGWLQIWGQFVDFQWRILKCGFENTMPQNWHVNGKNYDQSRGGRVIWLWTWGTQGFEDKTCSKQLN